MKGVCLRVVAFALSLSLGLLITGSVYSILLSNESAVVGNEVAPGCDEFCPFQRPRDIASLEVEGTVLVKFDRFVTETKDRFRIAEFTVTNNSSSLIYYTSSGKDDSPSYRLRSDGEEPFFFDCAMGLDTYHLHPGDTMKVEAPLNRVIDAAPRKAGSVQTQIGFQFSRNMNGQSETFWADPITVSIP